MPSDMTSDESDESISFDLRRLQERLHAVTWPLERLQKTLGRVSVRFPSPSWSGQLNRIGQEARWLAKLLEELPD